MEYKFKYKRLLRLFWRRPKVVGHKLDLQANSITLYFKDGSIRRIPEADRIEFRLGTDWILMNKKQMEEIAGRDVPLKGDIKC